MLLAGAISALGYAPLNLWPLPFLMLALLIDRVMRVERAGQVYLATWLFGLAHFLIALNWIATAFTYQENMPPWIGWVAVTLLSAYLALFPALAAALAWQLSRHQRLGFVLLFAAAWMLCEWLRAWLLGGFAWNPIAVIWLPVPLIPQAAKWIGTYGLSGLVVLVAGLLWLGLRTQRRATLAAALVLVIGGILPASWTAPARRPSQHASSVPVRVVQPNISQDEKNDPGLAEPNIRRYAVLSGVPTSEPRVLLWPEGATLSFLEYEPLVRLQLARLLGPRDILLTGGASVVLDMQGNHDVFHNSVFTLDSTGKIIWRYDKAHLVPFGEFLPLRPILERIGLSRLVESEGDFSPGPGPQTFVLPGFVHDGKPVTMGVQICYEIIFSGRVVDEAHRPSFLFNPSNDAWFGAWGPPQHLAQAQLRAIEEGMPIIRATPNGISALISPTGQVLARVERHKAGVIDTGVPEALPPTLFARIGLWTSLVFGLCLAAAGAIAKLRSSRAVRATADAEAAATMTRADT